MLTHIVAIDNDVTRSVYAVYPDKKGNLLVGTGKGLFVLRGGELVKFQRHRFRVDNPVYFITEDHEGLLWFGVSNGVIRWDGTAARHYTRQDGLVGNETNRAAGYVDSSGNLWIGMESGVSCYHRDRDREKNTPPLLELLHLDASGIEYPLDRSITLKHHRNDLTFHFRGISFIDEGAVTYNLKLEGFDREWLNGFRTHYNQIRYTNVSPGKYRFHIQAVNNLGVESPILSSGFISISRPLHQTVWFYLLSFFLLLVIIYFIANFISKKRYASRLEEQVGIRTRQLEASEKDFRGIFECAHDAIVIFKPEKEIVYDVNQRACEMYGFSREEFIGMSLEDISKYVDRGRRRVKETLASMNNYSFETAQYRKDGSEMSLEIYASVINYKGKTAILSINRDITLRKQAERQIKKSLQEKEVLLKEIHHRVKNNLQVISSLLDLQFEPLEDLHDQRDRQILKAFQQSKDRIRSMALIHEGLYQSGDLTRIDVQEYTQNLVDYLLSSYGGLAKNVTARIRMERDLSSFSLTMDTAIPFGLILTELFTNALKHAFPSGRSGEIQILFRVQTPGRLTVTVSDNGVGLPPGIDYVHNPKTLGMELVTMLVQQLKGTIEIDSGKGTAVTITFPYLYPVH